MDFQIKKEAFSELKQKDRNSKWNRAIPIQQAKALLRAEEWQFSTSLKSARGDTLFVDPREAAWGYKRTKKPLRHQKSREKSLQTQLSLVKNKC